VIRLADGFEEVERPSLKGIQQASILPNRVREKVEIAPIKWMKGQNPFTIQDALTEPASRLQITLQQLLDCSPRLRQDRAELLRSSVPRSRKKKFTSGKKPAEPITLHSAQYYIGRDIVSEAVAGTEDNV